MGALSAYLSKWWLDKKIYFRIHFRYLKMFPGCRIRSVLSTKVEGLIRSSVVIEENVVISDDLQFLGRGVYIGKDTNIGACTSIGHFTSISAGVRVGLMAHPSDYISTSPVFYAKRRGWVEKSEFAEDQGKRTVIGNDVLLSANVLVRNGVTIGHGAIVGAGAVVLDDVPPYAIVSGVPARLIRYRFEPELIERLLESEWWNASDDEIRAAGHFSDPAAFLQRLNRKTADKTTVQ